MLKRHPIVISILFCVFFVISILTSPMKERYKETIRTVRTENSKTIRYNDIEILVFKDEKLSYYNIYKKDIMMNGKLNFYGYDVITGTLHGREVYCAKDESKNKSIIIFYHNKNLLKRAIFRLLQKNILYLTDYHHYRLSIFLFGYDKYNLGLKERWLYNDKSF